MKKTSFSLLLLAIVVIGTSCAKQPQSRAFVTNETGAPVTLYTEKDSVYLFPMQRTYLCDVEVQDGRFVSCGGLNWTFSLIDPIVKIAVSDTSYAVPESYQGFLKDVSSYMHHISLSSSTSSATKYEGSNYDYFLREDILKAIINAQ